jgi:hypothetical protein
MALDRVVKPPGQAVCSIFSKGANRTERGHSAEEWRPHLTDSFHIAVIVSAL